MRERDRCFSNTKHILLQFWYFNEKYFLKVFFTYFLKIFFYIFFYIFNIDVLIKNINLIFFLH